MQYFCTYIVAKIRILINMAYHVGMDYAPFRFFYAEKSVITLRHSSLVAKTPARFTCSHVNALTMAHRRCHLFARKCLWHKWFKADYAPFRFFYFPIIDCSQICFWRQVVGGTPNCFLKVLLKIWVS